MPEAKEPIPRPQFYSAFTLQDRVHIDGDRHITASVTAILFRTDRAMLELSWLHNGGSQVAWVEPWRVTPAEK